MLTHRILKRKLRPWGWEALVEILDGEQVLEGLTPVWDHSPSDNEIDARMETVKARMQERLDWEALRSREFDDIGPEIKEALFWLIRKIRQYPGATLTQAETAWNAEWADSLFTWDRLVTFFRNRVGGITWNEFKTYVINRNFEGVD